MRIAGIAVCAAAAWTLAHASVQTPPLATFHRQLAPFPVESEPGRIHALPFIGGLDAPRPQFVDIDGDGDRDLFLQEYADQLWFFENVGTAAAPRYAWRSDRFQDVQIGEWYRFVDIDQDGLVDLLGELPFSHIRHYRNTGTTTQPRFELQGPLRDAAGEPLFFDRQNIPSLVDLDCDRRLDFFAGRVDGRVSRYEAVEPGSNRFALITDFWEGIEIIGQAIGIGFGMPTMHGANALAFGDFDDDKDLDLFWGDFFEPGVLLIENIGRTCTTASFQSEPVRVPYARELATSGYNSPVPVDLDGDGDLDLLMGVLGGSFNPVGTSADNFFYWERTAPNDLVLRSKRYLDGVDLGSETIPAIADIDADGDLDLVVGTKLDPMKGDAGRVVVFENAGSAARPHYRMRTPKEMAGAYHMAPALGDLDADGDLDMLLGTFNQDVLFYRNAGTPAQPDWVREESGDLHPARMSNAVPALGDLDADGDLDLVLGQSSGAIVFYRNVGTPKAPKFALATGTLGDIKAGRRTAPALVDVDSDGRLDLVLGRESGGMSVFRQTGMTGGMPQFAELTEFTLPLPPISSPRFADLDGDGVVDVLSGTLSGGLVFYQGRR